MKLKSVTVFSLLIALLLAGCQQSSTSIIQTPVPTKAPPTNTSEPIPTKTFTPTPAPTKQPTPTFTPTQSISPEALFLSDIRPYNGPVNVMEDLSRDRVFWQDKIWINGVYYPKGLGMHAPEAGIGYVSYKVPNGYTKFISLAGLAWQDGNPGCESVGDAKFRVFVNDELKFASDVVRFGPPVSVQIPVHEGDILRLEVDKGGDDVDCDHSTWAEARFEP